jgi:Chalcone isomerase-like
VRKVSLSLAVLLFLTASTFNLAAANLAGVTLPDTVSAGGKTLVLNGMGIRTKMMVKVYVGGLYLEQKSSDANAIIKSDAPKQIVMKFLHGASKSQMTDAFDEGFRDNAPDAVKTMKAQIDQLLGGLDAVKIGDEMVFTYVPGTGSSMAINGQNKVTIADPAFGPVLLSVWLGPKPPNADLKKGMLGQ